MKMSRNITLTTLKPIIPGQITHLQPPQSPEPPCPLLDSLDKEHSPFTLYFLIVETTTELIPSTLLIFKSRSCFYSHLSVIFNKGRFPLDFGRCWGGLRQVWGQLWSLDFRVGVFHEFLLINFVGAS